MELYFTIPYSIVAIWGVSDAATMAVAHALAIIILPTSLIALTLIGTGIGLFAGIGIAINNHAQEKKHVTVTS